MARGWLVHDRQGWLIAVLLSVMMIGDLPPALDVPDPGRWWALPAGVLMTVPAILAARWPVVSGVAATGVLVGWSVVLHAVGAVQPLMLSETVAVSVVIAAVVRTTSARTATAVVGLLLAGHTAARVIRGWQPESVQSLVWQWVVPTVFGFGAAVIAGLYLRGRDTAGADATRSAVAAARQRERVHLARELHDVVAHHVGAIVVQAQAARVVADPGSAVRALPVIEEAGSDALTAMRRVVAVLRDGDPDGEVPVRTTDLVADLRRLVTTGPHGTPVHLTVDLAQLLPAEVATSVLRLVQESVTNARRHAAGAHGIVVTVHAAAGTARVSVSDDGRTAGPARTGSGGFGLVGMRERVQLLGGRFAAGPGPDGGWHVLAELPLTELPPSATEDRAAVAAQREWRSAAT